jgi:hypothetical protein
MAFHPGAAIIHPFDSDEGPLFGEINAVATANFRRRAVFAMGSLADQGWEHKSNLHHCNLSASACFERTSLSGHSSNPSANILLYDISPTHLDHHFRNKAAYPPKMGMESRHADTRICVVAVDSYTQLLSAPNPTFSSLPFTGVQTSCADEPSEHRRARLRRERSEHLSFLE